MLKNTTHKQQENFGGAIFIGSKKGYCKRRRLEDTKTQGEGGHQKQQVFCSTTCATEPVNILKKDR
ncbi:MAG: hypothetical protein ACOYMS_08615, partial [Terrimicrobiaceae bacterium]